jgi:hypothetical protein
VLQLVGWLDDQAIGYAISAAMSPQLGDCIAALPEDHWQLDHEERDAIREWAEVNYLPSDGIWNKDAVSPRRYLAIRVHPGQGELLHDGDPVRHFCIATDRLNLAAGRSLHIIADRHEALRTTFDFTEWRADPVYRPARPPIRALIDLDGRPTLDLAEEACALARARLTRRSTLKMDH